MPASMVRSRVYHRARGTGLFRCDMSGSDMARVMEIALYQANSTEILHRLYQCPCSGPSRLRHGRNERH